MSDSVKGSAHIAALERSLRRRFRVVETSVAFGSRSVEILHPASAEDLINEVDFERDERLPYWAELWPSARILAKFVLGMDGRGSSVLELGCGSGLVTSCAALAGFDVTASDYYEDACRFAEVNAWRNAKRGVAGLMIDWRDLPRDLPRFDVVVASDVLYERPYGELVASAIAASLAEHGVAYLADPGRVAREDFLRHLSTLGLVERKRTDIRYSDGEVRQTIGLFEIARAP